MSEVCVFARSPLNQLWHVLIGECGEAEVYMFWFGSNCEEGLHD